MVSSSSPLILNVSFGFVITQTTISSLMTVVALSNTKSIKSIYIILMILFPRIPSFSFKISLSSCQPCP